jgi:hypothetical protein
MFQVFTAVLIKVQVFGDMRWCEPAAQLVTDIQEELAVSIFIVQNVQKRKLLGPEYGGSKFLRHPKRRYLYINVHVATPRKTIILVSHGKAQK